MRRWGKAARLRRKGRSAADQRVRRLPTPCYLQVKPVSTLIDWFEFDGFRRRSAGAEALLARPVSSRYIWQQGGASVGAASLSWRRIGAPGKMAVVPLNRPEVPGQGA
jgi:hypothetical protein